MPPPPPTDHRRQVSGVHALDAGGGICLDLGTRGTGCPMTGLIHVAHQRRDRLASAIVIEDQLQKRQPIFARQVRNRVDEGSCKGAQVRGFSSARVVPCTLTPAAPASVSGFFFAEGTSAELAGTPKEHRGSITCHFSSRVPVSFRKKLHGHPHKTIYLLRFFRGFCRGVLGTPLPNEGLLPGRVTYGEYATGCASG